MARQDGREDELVVDGRHGFPFGLKARLRGAVHHSGMAPPLRKTRAFRLTDGTDFGRIKVLAIDHSRHLPDVRPAPQAGCFVSGLSVSYESQIALRHRAFGTVAVAPSSTSSSLELSTSPWWVECPSAPQLSWPLAILSKPDLA